MTYTIRDNNGNVVCSIESTNSVLFSKKLPTETDLINNEKKLKMKMPSQLKKAYLKYGSISNGSYEFDFKGSKCGDKISIYNDGFGNLLLIDSQNKLWLRNHENDKEIAVTKYRDLDSLLELIVKPLNGKFSLESSAIDKDFSKPVNPKQLVKKIMDEFVSCVKKDKILSPYKNEIIKSIFNYNGPYAGHEWTDKKGETTYSINVFSFYDLDDNMDKKLNDDFATNKLFIPITESVDKLLFNIGKKYQNCEENDLWWSSDEEMFEFLFYKKDGKYYF